VKYVLCRRISLVVISRLFKDELFFRTMVYFGHPQSVGMSFVDEVAWTP
jgi:hypothetical protein